METGLSVDDRPNELNIAFWVISSVGAGSPLLLHIIYVSVHATSLSFPLHLFLSFHAPPPHNTHHYFFLLQSSLSPCLSSFRSYTASFFSLHLSSLPLRPLASLFPHFISLISFHSFFSHSLFPSVSLYCVYRSLLFYSLYLCLPLCPSLPPSLSSSSLFFFLSDTLRAFFLSSYLSL